MTNSLRGAVAFEVDGQPYHLRFSTNAMVRYEDLSGETVREAFFALLTAKLPEEGEKKPDLKKLLAQERGIKKRVRRLFWAGLSHKDMTEEDAGDLVDAVGEDEAGRILGEALKLAFPQPKEADEGNAPKAARGKPRAAKPETSPA